MSLPDKTNINVQPIMYVSEEEYATLDWSSVPIGTQVKVVQNGLHESDFDSSLQQKVNRVLQGTTAPTSSTVGYVGQLYVNTTNAKIYKCTAATGGVYTWEEVGGGLKLYLHEMDLEISGGSTRIAQIISPRSTAISSKADLMTEAVNSRILNFTMGTTPRYSCLYWVNVGSVPETIQFAPLSVTGLGSVTAITDVLSDAVTEYKGE